MNSAKVREYIETARWNLTKIHELSSSNKISEFSDVEEYFREGREFLQKAEDEIKLPNAPIGPVGPNPFDFVMPSDWKRKAGLGQIPFAVQSIRKLATRGFYPEGYPRGAVVHFTAGRYELGKQNAINELLNTEYTFVCIATDGTLVQGHDIRRWGNHAGESALQKIASKFKVAGSVSDDLIGIEQNNAGMLTKIGDKFYAWFHLNKLGKPNGTGSIPGDQVRYVTEKEWGCPTGYYHKLTRAQEQTLFKTNVFFKVNDPVGCFEFDRVVGHHEVAGKYEIGYWRKDDPGGSLSMPMKDFRSALKLAV